MKSDLVDVEVQLHHETERALLVSLGDKRKEVWIPKSQCEISEAKKGSVVRTLTLPEWLAIDKGLV